MLAALLALGLGFPVHPGWSQTPEQVQEAERARVAREAERIAAEARMRAARVEEQRLAGERVAAAARLRDLELATGAAADRLADIAARQRAAEARIRQRAEEMRPLLPVMERLALYPAETLLAVPLSSEQAVRGLIVLGGISRQLEADAEAVRADQAELVRLRQAAEAEVPRLKAAQAAQANAAAGLDAAIAAAREQRRAAQDEATEASRQAAAEAARADSLRAALARLEAERRAAEERARREAEAAARQKREGDAEAARRRQEALARPAGPGLGAGHLLTMPVAGTMTRGWEEGGEAAGTAGVTFTAAPAARVVSPCAGRVVFANPFRSYGNLLIVDCGAGWHVVLAGLERFDVGPGMAVRAGEPVGVMAGWDAAAGGPRPLLYFELRRGGQPVNPAPYLRAKS